MLKKKKWCDKILIYGLGLMGGSIGLKVKSIGSYSEILGITRKKESAETALNIGAVDKADTNFKEFVSQSDFIIFALPPLKVLQIIEKIFPYIKPTAIITDVSSVKGKIYYEIEKLVIGNNLKYNKKVSYIGSHPMAGSEKHGIEHAKIDLFDDSMVFVTPFLDTKKKDMLLIREFWHSIGCKTKVITPELHDVFTAFTSHFPHLMSGILSNILLDEYNGQKEIKLAISNSFKDITRVSASDPSLWTEITLMNRTNILSVIEKYRDKLDYIRSILKDHNEEKILEFFSVAKKSRNILIKHNEKN
ncbi:prephenate dehydrogenase [bacterium]